MTKQAYIMDNLHQALLELHAIAPTQPKEKVVFHDKTTILLTGEDKIVVECAPGDEFSSRYGYLLCKFMELTGLGHGATEKRLKEVDIIHRKSIKTRIAKSEKKVCKVEKNTVRGAYHYEP